MKSKNGRFKLWHLEIIHDAADPTSVYLRRRHVIRVPQFGIFYHKIYRPDVDRFLHDHPWAFASLVLGKGYDEERFAPDGSVYTVRRRRFSFYTLGLNEFHRISRLYASPVRTLFFVGKRRKDWGFMTNKGWVVHNEYLAARSFEGTT